MTSSRKIGWTLFGAGITMLVRAMTRRVVGRQVDALPRPSPARSRSLGNVLLLATASGVLLALGDAVQQRRKQLAQAA